jgi:hypothetical protein
LAKAGHLASTRDSLRAARALDIEVPPGLLAIAEEVRNNGTVSCGAGDSNWLKPLVRGGAAPCLLWKAKQTVRHVAGTGAPNQEGQGHFGVCLKYLRSGGG